MGIPVVVSQNGLGTPVRPVDANAPLMTVSANGLGMPIVISDLGAPFVVEGLFDPSALFSNGEQGAWYDPSDLTTMFQDAAGTVPVTADGQPVGLIRDKSGRGNHASQSTVASKPTYRTNGVLSWLAFDGVDDFLVTGSIDFTSTDKVTLLAGLRKTSDNFGIIAGLGVSFGTGNGVFEHSVATGSPAAIYASAARGNAAPNSGQVATTPAVFPAPISNVVTGIHDIAGDLSVVRVDGQQSGTSTVDKGTGNFGNYAIRIGRRGNDTVPLSGNLYGLIIRGALTADPQLTQAERWMAKKTGVAI